MAGRWPTFSLRWLMAIVAAVAIFTAVVRPIYVYYNGTIFAPGFDEAQFWQIRVGMSDEEVEALMGAPLWKRAESPDLNRECWAYTDQEPVWACYERRWVHFEGGKVASTEGFYWLD